MTTRIVNGKRLAFQQLANQSISNMPSKTVLPQTSLPPPPPSINSTQTLTTRAEVAAKTRIVVVRTTGSAQDEQGETTEPIEQPSRAKSVDLSPMLTNGHTSVYIIRRPIPPPDTPRQTKLFEPPPDEIHRTTTTTTTPINNSQHMRTYSPTEEIITTPSSPTHLKTTKPGTSFTISISPTPDIHSETLKDHSSSPAQPRNSKPTTRRSRSKHGSLNTRHLSSEQILSSLALSTSDDVPKDTDRKAASLSFSRTKSTAVQTILPPFETTKSDPDIIHTRSRGVRNTQREKSPIRRRRSTERKRSSTQRIKSSKSVILIHPDDERIAVIENSYVKGGTVKPVIKRSKSFRTTHVLQRETDNESTEKLTKTSRWHACLDCLSRYMCLIIIICIILVIIGLAGVGVSAYFLATNSQNNLIPEIVGIAVGGVLVIAALCFFYCLLACIGSREGYFSYEDGGKRSGGQAFAYIPPSHPNSHLYLSPNHSEMYETKQTSLSTIPINRQKTVVNETNGLTKAKSFTIEMPEPLLTGRQVSPKTHERQLNKVVNNIGHIVDDTKKRYNGEAPTRVIVKVDKNAKTTS